MKNENICVGLLTYHAAHNYGSVLQAYATQTAIEHLGYKCSIINYRSDSQRYFYSLFGMPFGIKHYGKKAELKFFIDKITNLFGYPSTLKKYMRFENFIRNNLNITKMFKTGGDLKSELDGEYDIYLSGSDQVWNNHCCENCFQKTDTSGVYYFDWVSKGRKAAFSSSIGNMTFQEVQEKKKLLAEYSYIATRESKGKEAIDQATGRSVDVVLDPTFLLSKEDWKSLYGIEKTRTNRKYILIYSLRQNDEIDEWFQSAQNLAIKFGYEIMAIVPFVRKKWSGIEIIRDAGPVEFLRLYSNAQLVLADSFHGVVFSVIFRRNFYALGNKYYSKDIRKQELLERVGLQDRIVEDESDILIRDDLIMDYSKVEPLIESAIENSYKCLSKALSMEDLQ